MATSHGAEIDKLLHDYLHSADMRDRVQEVASASDAEVKQELSSYVRTGALMAASHAEVEEFDAGYGMRVSTLWRSYLVANRAGMTMNRTSFRRGAGMRRKKGFRKTAPFRKVARPSVFGGAVETMNKLFLDGDE